MAINNHGHVLLTAPQCLQPFEETYVWYGGPTLTLIPRPAGMLGFIGIDLNDNGVICGQAQFGSATGPRAALYDTNNGQWTILLPLNPPAGWSEASAINNNNEVCGYRSIGSKSSPVNPYQAFRWSPSTGFEDFGLVDGRNTAARDINDDGTTTVSTGAVTPGAYGYLWTRNGSSPIQPPDCISSDPGVINDLGIVGTGAIAQVNPLVLRTFEFWNGVFSPVNPLPGATSASFYDISAAGLISGRSNFGPSQEWRACVWVDAQPIELNALTAGSFAGILQEAWISQSGLIVAAGRDQFRENKAFLLTPVTPEPGDVTCDGQVNVNDLLMVINTWGPCAGCRSDIDGNAVVGPWDLVEIILHWRQ